MNSYLSLLRKVLEEGHTKHDRTGVGTRALFGAQLRFNLQEGFPLLTTKKLHTKSIIAELLWFLRGETNISELHKHGVTIWDEWADENGELGPIYGKQWRRWTSKDGSAIDQITELIDTINNNPDSRRMIVSAWNVAEIADMALPPCHCLFQFFVADGRLSCQLYQRSADIFLGVPFNIASYALLTHILALTCNLEVGDFIHSFGDVHLYNNHEDQAREQLSRTPRSLPKLTLLHPERAPFNFEPSDFVISDYNPHPKISAPIAV